jgi:hypothetical protein
MHRTTLIALSVLLIAIAASVVIFMIVSSGALAPTATTMPTLVGQALFTDGEYGFTLHYPQELATDYTFTSFYHLPATWRANALPEATGTPILSVIGYRSASDHSYPRYFDAEVRIGASSDPREVARCEQAATEQNEQPLPDVVLGGTTFKAFSFASAGMMQYVKGVSYRTVHEGSCIAVEKIATGSSYRDDPQSAEDIPDATLDAAYASLDPIANSFAFVNP